jgi:hypothetical protein
VDYLFSSIPAIQERLYSSGIPSIVIGGIAVAAWGEPRVTRDVELKILLSRHDADRLLSILSTDYRPLSSNPLEVLRKQALIFVEDDHGTRLDLLLADTPCDIVAIQRGRDVEVYPGIPFRVCSPEDLIIYKLISTRLRDHEDARGVIRRQADALDDSYTLDWLKQFEIALDDSTLMAEYRHLRGLA